MAFAFSCTKCGKCCKGGGPALSIDEVFKYQDVFIAGLRWTAHSVSDQHLSPGPGGAYAPSKELKEHFSLLCGALTRPGDSETHYPFIYPSVTGYDLAPGHGCTALHEDGTCNLHADKPQMCKSVPFDPMLPEPMQGTMLEKFTEYGCMTQTDEDLPEDRIFNGGRIVSGEYKNHYEARLSAMKRDVSALIPLIALLGDGDTPGSIGLPSLAYFLRVARSGAWIETSMMPLLMLLVVRLKQVTAQRARDYAAAQVRLIGSAIDAALKGRNKNYRDRTDMMRRYLGQYDALDKVLSEEMTG